MCHVRSIIEKLGQERISKLKIVGDKEVEQSLYGQLVNNKDLSSGMDEQLAKEAIKAGRLFIFVLIIMYMFCDIHFFSAEGWVLKGSLLTFWASFC